MRTSEPALEDYWTTLAAMLPEFLPDQQHIAVALYRQLAKGKPVSPSQIAGALGVPAKKASEKLAQDPVQSFVYAEKGQILGFAGLAVAPMHHEFRVNSQNLWTWCAWDSLFIPAALGETADVSSPDPENGERVRLTVAPNRIERVEPEEAVVSFPLPDADSFDHSAANVMSSFCHHVFFFTSRESGERWRARHERTFLYSLAEAFELGQRLVAKQFGHELRRQAAA